jgi:coenzyme PQQ precursor peptide PqqA
MRASEPLGDLEDGTPSLPKGRHLVTTVIHGKETVMKWVEPAYCELRLGFEVTAYAYTR